MDELVQNLVLKRSAEACPIAGDRTTGVWVEQAAEAAAVRAAVDRAGWEMVSKKNIDVQIRPRSSRGVPNLIAVQAHRVCICTSVLGLCGRPERVEPASEKDHLSSRPRRLVTPALAHCF